MRLRQDAKHLFHRLTHIVGDGPYLIGLRFHSQPAHLTLHFLRTSARVRGLDQFHLIDNRHRNPAGAQRLNGDHRDLQQHVSTVAFAPGWLYPPREPSPYTRIGDEVSLVSFPPILGKTVRIYGQMPETLAQKIDRLGELESQLAPWTPRIKEAQQLRSEVAAEFEALESKPVDGTIKGARFFSIVGPPKLQTRIKSMRAVWKTVGQKLFLARCSYTLTNLKEDAPDQYDKLVVAERTGPRDVKTFALLEKAA